MSLWHTWINGLQAGPISYSIYISVNALILHSIGLWREHCYKASDHQSVGQKVVLLLLQGLAESVLCLQGLAVSTSLFA